ncbi:hypothetical protein AB0D74_20785 [Streptomyces sp. NPDC048278]
MSDVGDRRGRRYGVSQGCAGVAGAVGELPGGTGQVGTEAW